VSATTITCASPAGSGTVSVTVTNPDTQSDTLPSAFTYVSTGGGGTPGQWITSFNLDNTTNCDWWFCDYYTAGTDYNNALNSAGLVTSNPSDPPVDALAFDKMGGQNLETCSAAYLRNLNGTGVSGSSFNICFVGDPAKLTNFTLLQHYSAIEFGDMDPNASGACGRAQYDPGNSTKNNNAYSNGLGIFLGELVQGWGSLNPPLAQGESQFLDGTYVLGSGSDARYNQINNYITQLAMRMAYVTAHEIGHSVGLVPGGGHCNETNCIMLAVLNLGGTYTNSSKFFATNCKATLGTNLGYTPVYARSSQTLRSVAGSASAVVRGVIDSAGNFDPMPEADEMSEMFVTITQYIKGAGPASVRVMVEVPLVQLPPLGTEVLLFLAQPDTAQVPMLGGYATLRGGDAGLVSLHPPRNPGAPDFVTAATLYAGPATESQTVRRLYQDVQLGGRLAQDAWVELSRIPGCGAYLSDAEKKALIDAFAADPHGLRFVMYNALTVLGHLGDVRALDPLTAFFGTHDAQGHSRDVADALRRIDPAAASAKIQATLPGEASYMLARKLRLLGFLGAGDALPRILAYTESTDTAVRNAAIIAAGETGSPAAVQPLHDILFSDEASLEEKKLAAVALSFVENEGGIPALVEAEALHPDALVKSFVHDFRRNAFPVRSRLAGGE
jgi:hypothetical protein